MTDKERLEEIKDEVESLRGDMSVTSIETETSADIILDDMEWLIEQAQRVQELEDIIYQDARQGMIEDLYEENKRYREALEFYALGRHWITSLKDGRDYVNEYGELAEKALEVEK